MLPHSIDQIFLLINLLGVVTFSVAGALKGIREGLDLLGITTMGVVTALGGGMLRDIIVGRIPNALMSPYDISLALGGVVLSLMLHSKTKRSLENVNTFLLLDAVGLSAFTATGALVAYEAGVSFYGVVLLATITGVGGGVLGDILLSRVPYVLREDFYATCSIVGAVVFYITMELTFSITLASVLCSLSTFVLRIFALRYGWRLPRLLRRS